MKKYRITYKPYFARFEKTMAIFALSEEEAINFFFENYSGLFLRIDFDGYV